VAVGSSTSSSFPEPAPFAVRRFSVEEYRRLGDAGVLTDEDRVELLEGVITPKMIHNPPHDAAIMLIEEALRPLLPSGWMIRIQSSITTSDSEPEPDLAVVRGTARDYSRRHPAAADVGLVVEVADTSLLRDRNKTRLYARAGVPTYWIVNLADSQIEVHWQPSGPCDSPEFQQTAVYRRGDHVTLTLSVASASKILVDELLP
jgi:Uma2 family endonuclease